MERQRIARLEQEEAEPSTKTNGKSATSKNEQDGNSQGIDLYGVVTNSAHSVQGTTKGAGPPNGRHD